MHVYVLSSYKHMKIICVRTHQDMVCVCVNMKLSHKPKHLKQKPVRLR